MRATRRLHPYSRQPALQKLDLRTKEARLIRETRAELTAHIGGHPSAVQQALIEQLVQLRLRLCVMDRAFAEGGGIQTAHDSRTYLAWANTYARTLKALGLKGAEKPAQTLANVLATWQPAPAQEPSSAPAEAA